MLKFLRKYQIVVLVIGGSLLMVVFLLEPVLTRIGPNPANAPVATIGPDNKKVPAADRNLAYTEVRAVAMFMPELLLAGQMGIALSPEENTAPDHWYLLTREAARGGFVGGPGDGESWIAELAPAAANRAAIQEAQQGLITSEQQFEARFTELTGIAAQNLRARIPQIAAANGLTDDQVKTALAKCRGVRRMINFYGRAPKPTIAEAVSSVKHALDAVQTEILTIPAGRLTDPNAEIPESELQAFFDEHRAHEPTDNPYGFSYILPERIKLSYLTLDAAAFAAALTPDRIELNKRWRADRTLYPGEYAEEAANVEADWRAAQAQRLIAEADQVIRAEVRRAMQGVPSAAGRYTLPEGWSPPDWEPIAQRVADELATAQDVRIPLPPVRTFTDRWLTANELNALPDLAFAAFRTGSKVEQVLFLPQMIDNASGQFTARPQVGVPMAEQSASNAAGSRFYITVLDYRQRSPADSIDEIDAARLAANYRERQAYEALTARKDELLALAREEGLNAVALALTPENPDDTRPPLRPATGALVTRTGVQRVFDSRIDTPAFRDAVIDRADTIDPLADPASIDPEQRYLAVELPASRALAIARIVAPRPLTTADFQAQGARAVLAATDGWLKQDDDAAQHFPYAYENLKARWDYRPLRNRDDPDPQPEPETTG